MNTATTLDPDTRRATTLFVERVRARFDASRVILFGSRARGDHRPDSDADIAVILRGSTQRRIPTVHVMSDLAFDVLLDTGVLVQPLPIWDEEWASPEQFSNPALLRQIEREGLSL